MDSKESPSRNDRHDEEWPVSSQTRLQLSPFRVGRVDASKKIVVDIRFFYRAVHYEAKKGRWPRGRRKRGKAEDDEGDAREFLASVPGPISTRVYSSGCALHGAQCNGRRYGRVAS